MKLIFDAVRFQRDHFTLSVDAAFSCGIHLISGRIGTGKSTLALAAAGILSPNSGEILYEEIMDTPLLLMQFPEYQEITFPGEDTGEFQPAKFSAG